MYKVLLVSVASFFDSTGEIPFMFKRAGCLVDIFCDQASWLLSNKYHDEWIAGSDDEEAFKNDLITLIESKPDYYDWVVLLEDVIVKLLNENITSEWLFKKLLPVTKIENREILSSKIGLSNICNKYGIATPRFINYSKEDNIDTISKKLQFPILLKEDFSFSGIGVHYCEDPSQFELCLAKVRVKTNLVLQEFIEGEDVGLEALFKDGELITYNCAEVLNYMYDKFSFTTRRRYYQRDELTNLLKTLAKSVGLNGFASMQYIYHPERKIYYLIELDMRTNSWMPYSRFTGNDFSAGIKRIAEGQISFMPQTTPPKKVEVVIFDKDIRRCIKHRDYKGLLKWLFNYHSYWKFIPFYDSKILIRVTKKMIYDFTVKLKKGGQPQNL